MSGTEIALREGGLAITERAFFDHAGLTFTEGTTTDELRRIAKGFNLLQDASCFAIGDLVNHYREHFREDYRAWIDGLPKQAKDRGTLDQATAVSYAGVCRKFPDHLWRARFLTAEGGRRVLSFAHFSLVRAYGTEQAERWLELASVEGWSYDQLRERLAGSTIAADDVPYLSTVVPDSRFGQSYWLGPPEEPQRHLLLCGDATVPEHLALVAHMGGTGRAAMVWTDPPYGVDYVGKTEDALTIQHDVGGEELYILLVRAWTTASPWLEESAPFYVAGPTGDNALVFLRSFHDAGWRYRQMLVWCKNTMVLGRQDYQLQHEGVYYGNGPGRRAGRMARDSFRWYGGDDARSVFHVDKPSRSREHPTMKPVRLIQPAIFNSSQPGEVVLDPFAGSGSTLIAADLAGRRCFSIEYDPVYADVVRARYAKHLQDLLAGLVVPERVDSPPQGTYTLEQP